MIDYHKVERYATAYDDEYDLYTLKPKWNQPFPVVRASDFEALLAEHKITRRALEKATKLSSKEILESIGYGALKPGTKDFREYASRPLFGEIYLCQPDAHM